MTYVNEIPKNLSHYDIVVGIPSFNNARAKRRVYDYLLEICNWMKSKSCVK